MVPGVLLATENRYCFQKFFCWTRKNSVVKLCDFATADLHEGGWCVFFDSLNSQVDGATRQDEGCEDFVFALLRKLRYIHEPLVRDDRCIHNVDSESKIESLRGSLVERSLTGLK